MQNNIKEMSQIFKVRLKRLKKQNGRKREWLHFSFWEENQKNCLHMKKIFERRRYFFFFVIYFEALRCQIWTSVIPWRKHIWLFFKLEFVLRTNRRRRLHVCKPYVEYLRQWRKKRNISPFCIPVIWQKPLNYKSNCYASLTKTFDYIHRKLPLINKIITSEPLSLNVYIKEKNT